MVREMLSTKRLNQFSQAYENDALKTAVYGASTLGLVVLLYQGATKAIVQAGQAIQAHRFDEKSRLTSKAIDIIDALRESLDLEPASEAATNLNDLYLYMKQRLVQANAKNDLEIFSEVRGLLEVILPAWQELDRGGAPGHDIPRIG